MKKIVILGTGGNCIDILDTLFDINDLQGGLIYECTGFLDDNPIKWNRTFHNVRVLGPLHMAGELSDCSFVFGIGSISNFWKRREIFLKAGVGWDRFETIIHPTASVSRLSAIGPGCVIFQNVTVATNVKMGNFVLVLPNCIISHDDFIDDFTCIAGGVSISGNVHIGKNCYVGTGSAIKENVTIGDDCLIGMGSIALRDIPENNVVIGNPAKFLRYTKT